MTWRRFHLILCLVMVVIVARHIDPIGRFIFP